MDALGKHNTEFKVHFKTIKNKVNNVSSISFKTGSKILDFTPLIKTNQINCNDKEYKFTHRILNHINKFNE